MSKALFSEKRYQCYNPCRVKAAARRMEEGGGEGRHRDYRWKKWGRMRVWVDVGGEVAQ